LRSTTDALSRERLQRLLRLLQVAEVWQIFSLKTF
jgi:hypothetical protein